jgi:ABC-type transporter MlaC component
MIPRKSLNPAERILAALDEGPEIENYAIHEIEALPIEEVRRRLDELGVDSSLPAYIKSLSARIASPAQKVLDALDDEGDQLSPEEIEHLPLEQVKVGLNSLGLNYLAGAHKIRELTGATFDGQQDDVDPKRTWWGRILTYLKIAGVVAALAKIIEPTSGAKIAGFAAAVTAALAFIFVVANRNPLEDKRAQFGQEPARWLQQQIPDLHKWVGAPGFARASFEGDTTSKRNSTATERHAVALPGGAQDAVRSFYDVLLVTMKDQTLGKGDRYQRLASIVDRTFNLPFMARLVMGQSDWASLSPVQQQSVTEALRHYIAATYADNFASYSGEELLVTGERLYGEGVIVLTKIVQSNGETDFVDYVMRHDQGSWQISDAYVDSAASELAKLRSEFFRPIIQREGSMV